MVEMSALPLLTQRRSTLGRQDRTLLGRARHVARGTTRTADLMASFRSWILLGYTLAYLYAYILLYTLDLRCPQRTTSRRLRFGDCSGQELCSFREMSRMRNRSRSQLRVRAAVWAVAPSHAETTDAAG